MSSGVTTWSFPTRVLFGLGATDHIGEEALGLYVKKALIITDKGVNAAGLVSRVQNALNVKGIASAVFSDVSSNPTEAEVVNAATAYTNAKADAVVGLGGGSPLDAAKLVRLAVTHPLPLVQYDDAAGGSSRITNPLPPMIAIPTTAGTGSEVGRSGVVTIEQKKTVIFAPSLIPNVAILDPAMTTTMPAGMTAATGMDALTHCIEAYCALGDHPMADALAIAGVQLCGANLATAVRDGNDIEARGNMLKAAMFGAVAFQKGLGVCHSLAHPLSSHHGLHHGLANAICLPAVVDFNLPFVQKKLAAIARALGVVASTQSEFAQQCAHALRSLREEIALPNGLSECGLSENDLTSLASLAMKDGCHTLNPRPCSEHDMLALYKASM